MQDLSTVWELDSIFPGGSASAELEAWLERLAGDIAALQGSSPSGEGREQWRQFTERVQDIALRLSEASSFIHCLGARDVKDEGARLLGGRLQQLEASFKSVLIALDQSMLAVSDAAWRRLMAAPELAPLAFPLDERRTDAREKMAPEQEKLVADLAVDGYHGWADQYELVAGRISIPWEREGRVEALSAGQARNVFDDLDPAARAAMAVKWEQAWAEEAEVCADILNHIGGFRQSLYRHRGWDSVLKEPLALNRMSAETLEAMWDAVESNLDPFVRYLERRKELLGLDRLSWFDLDAPLGQMSRKFTFTRACRFVMEQLAGVCPRMAHFCAGAFQKRWVEAEDRPGKRAGAFCCSFPASRQSRVFMTFAGSPGNVSTLAHEMGHAYHHHVMSELPYLARRYAMNVAETASTFAEMVVAGAAVERAATREVKIALLDGKVRNSVSYLMDIRARFLFERAFYERRRSGPLGIEELNGLMLEAQERAYRNSLDSYHAHFWASKLHFYLTRVPFYNFPYTFGYLFSAGIYALAREGGRGFEERYVKLLRDTGRMRVEDLAARHLGVDLTEASFWERALSMTAADAAELLRLTE